MINWLFSGRYFSKAEHGDGLNVATAATTTHISQR
jgi:hypothetical protein